MSLRHRVSYQQLQSLWDFLNSHKEIAIGYNKSAQAREYSQRMWTAAAESLNCLGDGATKDWKGWSSYWVDYKSKLKRRVAALRASQGRTGGGPSEVIPLNDLEKKFLSILGQGYRSGLPDTQVDPFPTLPQLSSVLELEPVAGPSYVEQGAHVEEFNNIFPQEVPMELSPPLPQPPAPRSHEHRPRTSGGRRRQSATLTSEAARRTLIEVSKARLEIEKCNSRVLREIAESQKRSVEVWEAMLCTLNSIAERMNVSTGEEETSNERRPDC